MPMRLAAGNTIRKPSLKELKEYAIECSILKVAPFRKNVQNVLNGGLPDFWRNGFSEDTA